MSNNLDPQTIPGDSHNPIRKVQQLSKLPLIGFAVLVAIILVIYIYGVTYEPEQESSVEVVGVTQTLPEDLRNRAAEQFVFELEPPPGVGLMIEQEQRQELDQEAMMDEIVRRLEQSEVPSDSVAVPNYISEEALRRQELIAQLKERQFVDAVNRAGGVNFDRSNFYQAFGIEVNDIGNDLTAMLDDSESELAGIGAMFSGTTIGDASSLEETVSDALVIKRGQAIPASMLVAVNSELPGMVVAMVTRNVFDTATGEHLLIPQGARIVGQYTGDMALGQRRLTVTWDEIQMPDGESVFFEPATGYDLEGRAGFTGRLQGNFVRKYGSALLLSVLGAGYGAGVPQRAADEGLSLEDQVAININQQFAELGARSVERNMQIKDTLEIEAGYSFSVLVNQDLVFSRDFPVSYGIGQAQESAIEWVEGFQVSTSPVQLQESIPPMPSIETVKRIYEANQGELLSNVVNRWSEQNNYSLVWDVETSSGERPVWSMASDVVMYENYYEAVIKLLGAYRTQLDQAPVPFIHHFYEDRVLVVTLEE